MPAIIACAVTPANRPEEEGAPPLAEDIQRQGFTIEAAHVDRAARDQEQVAEPSRGFSTRSWRVPQRHLAT